MHNHAPKNYKCPFCLLVKGIENQDVRSRQADIFYKDKYITGFVASDWWPNNPGNALIIPNRHIENIYDLPDNLSDRIHRLEKRVALAFKKLYKSEGTSTRQHNEPAGGQDVWHYHVQVFPRYKNDRLYEWISKRKASDPKTRKLYTDKLRKYFKYKG